MAIEVFNRYEHKYMLDRETFLKVLKVLDEHMVIDTHNKNYEPYTIANIYMDTPDDLLIRNSLSKPRYKEKLRLRTYGGTSDDSMVFLETKKKFRGIVSKRRTKLKLKEAKEFLLTGKPPEIKDYMNPQVVKEIEYMLSIYDLSPKVFLSYDRIAYFEKDNDDLRISFDMNIRSRRDNLDFKNGFHGRNLLPEDTYVMEIKTSTAKPLWLTAMLSELEIKRQSFSKYGTEFKYNLSKGNNFHVLV